MRAPSIEQHSCRGRTDHPCALSPRHRVPAARFGFLVAATLVSLSLPGAAHAQISITESFYVPQTGPVATPTEGTAAARFFTQCPNNDSPFLIANDARIKVVVKDILGTPIPGIAAADICIRLNGGTAVQGYPELGAPAGADSIIANSIWNTNPLCPTVKCIPADAPTDALGITYITLAGSTPGSPGEATRDPSRKWGHFDSEIPVYVMGFPLSGKLTSASAFGTYVLRIKNVDVVDGLEATYNAGEYVSFRDLNVFLRELGGSSSISYWLDFNGDGAVASVDFNFMIAHQNHHCTFPNSP